MMRTLRNIVIFLAVAGLFGGAAYYYRDAVGKTAPAHGMVTATAMITPMAMKRR